MILGSCLQVCNRLMQRFNQVMNNDIGGRFSIGRARLLQLFDMVLCGIVGPFDRVGDDGLDVLEEGDDWNGVVCVVCC